MNIKDIIDISTGFLADYFSAFILTIKKQELFYKPIEYSYTTNKLVYLPDTKTKSGYKFNPQLFGFAVLSIFLGIFISQTLPGSNISQEIITNIIIALGFWVFFGYLISIVAGRDNFEETFSLTLQIISVVAVLSSFFAFIYGVIIFIMDRFQIISSLDVIVEPVYFSFFVKFILLLYYLPKAIKKLNGKRKNQITINAIIMIILILMLFTSFALFMMYGFTSIISPK